MVKRRCICRFHSVSRFLCLLCRKLWDIHNPKVKTETWYSIQEEAYNRFYKKKYTYYNERKRKISDSWSVLWQKPLHQQKCQKGKVTTQTSHKKFDYTAVTDRLRTVSWSKYGTSILMNFRRIYHICIINNILSLSYLHN